MKQTCQWHQSFFGQLNNWRETFLEECFLLQMHLGMSYTELQRLPVRYRHWYIKRLSKHFEKKNDIMNINHLHTSTSSSLKLLLILLGKTILLPFICRVYFSLYHYINYLLIWSISEIQNDEAECMWKAWKKTSMKLSQTDLINWFVASFWHFWCHWQCNFNLHPFKTCFSKLLWQSTSLFDNHWHHLHHLHCHWLLFGQR